MHKVLLLPGDGIGPEIIKQVEKALTCFKQHISYETALIGGDAIDQQGCALPETTLKTAKQADAVLLGAVGGEKWNALPLAERPEYGLLALRKELEVFANIRPLEIWPELMAFSPLKPERLSDVSFVIVRELTGGLYFGTPRGSEEGSALSGPEGQGRAWNTMVYSEGEIIRIAKTAFELAQKRRKKLCSIDKANVLECMRFWRKTVERVHQDYPDVDLSHMYVDHAAMQIITQPSQFDVMLTPNMFGDILSDEAAVLPGSLGMLGSASLGKSYGLYEPIHGSAPDIAGQGIANPIGAMLSLALLFDYSCQNRAFGNLIRCAVSSVLKQGIRTEDICTPEDDKVSTHEMGDKIVQEIKSRL